MGRGHTEVSRRELLLQRHLAGALGRMTSNQTNRELAINRPGPGLSDMAAITSLRSTVVSPETIPVARVLGLPGGVGVDMPG